ncbi:MAG TPA: hypothetical protein VN428_08305 [Bryobacteraceae bacterium]|nr:hypothetical protein [Bryobacteraceae bacterium]
MTYKGFRIIPAAVQRPDGSWMLEGAIGPEHSEAAAERFDSENFYPSEEAANQHFVEFAKRYIDGNATRADL